jgi:hypothetical protein
MPKKIKLLGLLALTGLLNLAPRIVRAEVSDALCWYECDPFCHLVCAADELR